MKPIIKKIINQIQKLINDDNFKTQYKTKETDFIRNRKINFSDTVLFVIGLSNTSFDFERIKSTFRFKRAAVQSKGNAGLSPGSSLPRCAGTYWNAPRSRSER